MEEKTAMDFVEWCDFVLTTCIKAGLTLGLNEFSLAETLSAELGVPNFRKQPNFLQSTYCKGAFNALKALGNAGLIESPNHDPKAPFCNISKAGRDYIFDVIPFWSKICQERIGKEHEQVLLVINQLSQKTAQDHAWLEMVSHEAVVSQLGETDISRRLWVIAHELHQWGFISGVFSTNGTGHYQSTYKGLVWETRHNFTLESKVIDNLVREWETTSVDFKQELHLDKASEKAEFIKDILSLANTQASGRRWLIIGFKDKTRTYFGPPDPKVTQNRMEQIIAEYIDPYLDIDYKVIEYRGENVGKLEVIRDPTKLPYRVKKQINGDKKPLVLLQVGDIFVRHGSQVQKPGDAELQDIQAEGDRARSMHSGK